MARSELHQSFLLAGLLFASVATAEGYYVCQDPKTGKKAGQDHPCEAARELKNYPPASAEELKAREETARQGKREFEQLHPGTYRPEEYMTPEELADYQSHAKEREAEQERRKQAAAIEAANRKAAQAEQRAIEAESAARQAEARAVAAQEAAANVPQTPQPVLLVPYPPPRMPTGRAPGRDSTRQDKPPVSPGKRPSPHKETDGIPRF